MKTIRLNEKAIKAVFETAPDQSEALLAIYRMVFPQWDQIKKIDGWPTCNKTTWVSICEMFMELDNKRNAGVLPTERIMPGGMWMNNGFSSRGGEQLKDWEVELCPVTLAEVANAA